MADIASKFGLSGGGGNPNALLNGWASDNDYSSSMYYPPTVDRTAYATGVQALIANRIIYVPFVCRKTHTFTKLALYNSSAAETGRKFRLGVYDTSNGRPSTLLQDGGETTLGGAAAFNEVTISQQLAGGKLYFIAGISNGDISGPRMTSAPSGSFIDSRALVDLGYNTGSGVVTGNPGFYESLAYAALPASATPVCTTIGAAMYFPLIWIKG